MLIPLDVHAVSSSRQNQGKGEEETSKFKVQRSITPHVSHAGQYASNKNSTPCVQRSRNRNFRPQSPSSRSFVPWFTANRE